MKLRFLSLAAPAVVLALVACGGGSEVCPPDWNQSSDSPGDCAPPSSFVTQTTASIGSGVYGFMRTNAQGSGDQLVVGAKVFALPSTSTSCDAASVNEVGQAVTDDNGIYTMQLPAGDYFITSGEIPVCTAVHVDANTISDVALTSD